MFAMRAHALSRLALSVLVGCVLMVLVGCSRRIEMPPETTFSPELKLRAEQGDLRAQHQLGVVLMKGDGIKEDPEEGFRWVAKASLKNYPPSQLISGIMLRATGSRDKGLEMITRAAEQGLPEAQMLLGVIFLNGDGKAKDVTQAIFWLQKAGEGGNGDAFTNIGHLYWDGDGVNKDRRLAANYWKRAAEMGFLHGQNDYAWYLATNYEGGQRNGKLAVQVAQRAVGQKKDCTTLDTLAAAYAENGEFEKAVDTQRKALESFKNMDDGALAEWSTLPTEGELRLRLKMYQDGIPFREE